MRSSSDFRLYNAVRRWTTDARKIRVILRDQQLMNNVVATRCDGIIWCEIIDTDRKINPKAIDHANQPNRSRPPIDVYTALLR